MNRRLSIPTELSAIAGQLETYCAPRKTVHADENCRLSYEILRWDKTHFNEMTDNTPIGTVEISRYRKGSETDYYIHEKRLAGTQEVYKASVTTTLRQDDFGESILNWRLDWHQPECPAGLMHTTGTVNGECLVTDGTPGKKHRSITVPVLCPWVIPFALAHRQPNTKLSGAFTSIDELTYCKTDQQLNGPERLSLQAVSDNIDSLFAYRHIGPATLPIHYVFDPQGRPLFVTFTMLSWVLRGIDIPPTQKPQSFCEGDQFRRSKRREVSARISRAR